ncbi:hypothetical protein SARC_04208 [Sphaeroforma arctica JP610]|uniref:Uncharacterized protein n=1 Tax=Sphaeroforma arctica JP610 TaxID=667725 RepID=A0A0L0G381_9EUKA|nr:hypothetical protein SARC_04208 [Sphaeroforma arctica JP610]KNC83535.1 hypothetical protein SARC_04208 [Sphaeroforma arctica JP610]|eukprot:XP_014157437.1 hypothetical protein SARC_04208 [Sphaeroforma arctica JP610]
MEGNPPPGRADNNDSPVSTVVPNPSDESIPADSKTDDAHPTIEGLSVEGSSSRIQLNRRRSCTLPIKLSDGGTVRERPKPAQLDLVTHLPHGPNSISNGTAAIAKKKGQEDVYSPARVVRGTKLLRRVSFADISHSADIDATTQAILKGVLPRVSSMQSTLQVSSPVIALSAPSQDAISGPQPVSFEVGHQHSRISSQVRPTKDASTFPHTDSSIDCPAEFSNENGPTDQSHSHSHPFSSPINRGILRETRQSSPLAVTFATDPSSSQSSTRSDLAMPKSFGQLPATSNSNKHGSAQIPVETRYKPIARPASTSAIPTTASSPSRSRPISTEHVTDDKTKHAGGTGPYQRTSVVDGHLSPSSFTTPHSGSNFFGVFGVLSPKAAKHRSPSQTESPKVGFFRRLTSSRFHRTPQGSPSDGATSSSLISPDSLGTDSPRTLATPRTVSPPSTAQAMGGFEYPGSFDATDNNSPQDLNLPAQRRRASSSSVSVEPIKTSAVHTSSTVGKASKNGRSFKGSARFSPRSVDLVSPDSRTSNSSSPRRGTTRSPRNVLATVSYAVGDAMFEPIVNPTNNARKAYIPKQNDLPENMDQDIALDASFQVYRVMIVRNKTKNEELQFKYAIKSSNLCILKLTVSGVALVPVKARSTGDGIPIYKYKNLKAINLKDPKKEKNIKIVAFEFREGGATDVLAVASHECSEIIARLKMLLWKSKYSGHYR